MRIYSCSRRPLILTALTDFAWHTQQRTTTTSTLAFLHHRCSYFFFIALLKLGTHLHLMKFSCMHFTLDSPSSCLRHGRSFRLITSTSEQNKKKNGNLPTSLPPTEGCFLTINPAASEFLLIHDTHCSLEN